MIFNIKKYLNFYLFYLRVIFDYRLLPQKNGNDSDSEKEVSVGVMIAIYCFIIKIYSHCSIDGANKSCNHN